MDRDFLIDLFASFGPVTIRPMFSGFGISADGVNFALALRSGLYLRADEATIARFEASRSKPFQYETRARAVTVNSYWQVPAHLFDDVDEFGEWARAALAAAQRAALSKRAKPRKVARADLAAKAAKTGPGHTSGAGMKKRSAAKPSAEAAKRRPTKNGRSKAAKTR